MSNFLKQNIFRYSGASILVTKGDRNLHTCGLLDQNKNKVPNTGIYSPKAHQQVKVTFESRAQEINSGEGEHQIPKIKHAKTKLGMIGKKEKPVNKREIYKNLEAELNSDSEITSEEQIFDEPEIESRFKRSQKPVKPELLDRGIQHGGNAPKNDTSDSNESDISSFENNLLVCYSGNLLLQIQFNHSVECNNVGYLLNDKEHMQATHEIDKDGYYYYIFYSNNDNELNDIHAVFDIYKPTLQYENVTMACLNQTECKFNLFVTSKDRVIVEVPTKDGIDRDLDDTSLLLSVCNPRMGIYAIFPVAIIFLVLGCAFI